MDLLNKFGGLEATIDESHIQAKPFLDSFRSYEIPWRVTLKELEDIADKTEFIRTHFLNMGCPLKPTNRIMAFPLHIVHALAHLKDEKCAKRLYEFLAEKGSSFFNGSEPDILNLPPHDALYNILGDLFMCYFMDRCKDQPIEPHFIYDYFSLSLVFGGSPNLKIRSFKRLKKEHDTMMKNLNIESMDDFLIADSRLLPPEANGFFFQQIINKELLIKEADELEHCIVHYAEEIKDGSSIVYSISGKERATAEIVDEGTRLNQVFSFDNTKVSIELTNFLKDQLIRTNEK